MYYYDNPGGSIPTMVINWAAKVTKKYRNLEIELARLASYYKAKPLFFKDNFKDYITGRERLIRSHSSARFCFKLSGNSN